ncbi:MAG: hypothetical protein K6G60_02245 [Lachnospiraceae bacterium]|nr:hypothetical protein [Lachnospiraceae bacterium]
MKYFFKTIYLIALFIAALLFFGNRMTETLSDEKVELTDPADSILPVVTLDSDNVNVNRLYGYTAKIDPLSVRECFVSIESDNAMYLNIAERGEEVRKLLYTVYDTATGRAIADGQVSAFDLTETGKRARIKINNDLVYSREYAVEAVLITSSSRRVYFYYRFKQYDEAYFSEKVAFIKDFSDACLTKNIDFVIPYLESKYRGEGTTYSHVDIYDSYYMVCWGDLEPKVISDVTVTVTELYKYIMVARLDYSVSLETDSGTETCLVTEKFRINLGTGSIFLMNYERDLEATFDPSLASIALDQLKLGISASKKADILSTSDNSMMCFVRNHTLYYYNAAENEIITVFSMNIGAKAPSDVNDMHDISVLRMDENGDLAFMVSGYINSGEYEGKTGLLLYEYYRSENRIKELLFVPIAKTYRHISAEMGGFAYLNNTDILYFTAYDTLYSYNLTTGVLNTLSKEPVEKAVFSKEEAYYAWQEKGDPSEIFLLFPEEDRIKTMNNRGHDVVILYDSIGSNMVCGFGDLADSAAYSDGTVYYPVSELCILDKNEEMLKLYSVPGTYVTAAEATDTSIRLTRVTDNPSGEGYIPTEEDHILIRNDPDRTGFTVDVRVTKKMMDEYYISLPYGYYLNSLPHTDSAKITVINGSTTVRIDALESSENEYAVYSYGKILGIRKTLHEAIALADTVETVGVVTDSTGFAIWERGVANRTSAVSGATVEKARKLLEKGIEDPISLTGATLSEVLYYVFRDLPVYAMPEPGKTVIITEYTPFYVTYIDPLTYKEYSDPIEEFSERMRMNGNVFTVVWERE